MAKKETGKVKLQIAAGKATPAPPVGPALGQAQINIMEFCKQFNARTSAKELRSTAGLRERIASRFATGRRALTISTRNVGSGPRIGCLLPAGDVVREM